MAAQKTPTTKKQLVKDNIAKFRQDRRLLVVGAFRGLGLLIMLAVLVSSVVMYQDYLNPAALRQGIRYLAAGAAQGDPALLDVDSEEDAMYLPMGFGMISASRDGFRYHSTVADNRFHIRGSFRTPALTAGNRLALIYDRGGKSLLIATAYSEVWSKTLDSSILSASMNRRGDFVLVTNETGYRCAVTVYDCEQNLLCKWLTSRYYIPTAAVSPNAEAFAVLCFGTGTQAMDTRVMLFRTGEESYFASIDLSGRTVCSVKYDNSGNLFILCEDGLLVVDSEGRTVLNRTFDGILTAFRHQDGILPLLVFTRADAQGEAVRVQMPASDGSLLLDAEYTGTFLDAATDGKSVQLLLRDRLISLLPGSEQAQETLCSGATGVLAGSGNNPILLYPDRAEKLRPAK